MKLDKSKPYGTITGLTADNARYRQNGNRYLADGTLIGEAKEVETVTVEPEQEASIEITQEETAEEVEQVAKKTDADPTETKKVDELKLSDFNVMSAGDIKKLVIKAGGEYVNRDQGIQFLLSE